MNPEKLVLRKNIVRLYEKGKIQEEIAEILDTSQSTVSYWIIRWRETRSLQDLSRSGKPSRLTQRQFTVINEALHDFPPSRYGGESMGWTTKMLLQFINDTFDLVFGIRYAQKIMHKCGIRLITPRPQHRKGSHAAKVVYRMDFKKNSRKNIWVAPSLISTRQRLG